VRSWPSWDLFHPENRRRAFTMATSKDRFMSAAVRAATQAKRWAMVAAREADRLLQAARKRAESVERRRRLKRTLLKTGRVLRSAGKAAIVAAVAAGVAAARAELSGQKLRKGRGR
jgi:hypothetical protein